MATAAVAPAPSILDAIIAADGAQPLPVCATCRESILPGEPSDRSPMGPVNHTACLSVVRPGPPPTVIPAPTLEVKRELALARFLNRKAEETAPQPTAGATSRAGAGTAGLRAFRGRAGSHGCRPLRVCGLPTFSRGARRSRGSAPRSGRRRLQPSARASGRVDRRGEA